MLEDWLGGDGRRETHSVTVAQRVNVEESEYFVAFEEFHRGDLAYDGVRSCFSRSFGGGALYP